MSTVSELLTKTAGAQPALPTARGPVSAAVLTALRSEPPAPGRPGPASGPWCEDALGRTIVDARGEDVRGGEAWGEIARDGDAWGEDVQLALYACYELHYQGFDGVDPGWEWQPELLALRGRLERGYLAALHAAVGPPQPLARALDRLLVEPADGSGPSHHLLAEGRRWQAREYLVHRSLYQLKEADPQLWAVPRLPVPAKAAMMAVQYDEYGAGRPERAHARLFAEAMADFGLDPGYGRYLDAVPAPALAVVNMMTMFGLHRALRGALVGQFAALEITSSPGAERLATAFERLGASPAGTRFHREHVLADAVHEQLVRHTVIEPLVGQEPALAADIAFGIAATGATEDRLGDHLVAAWRGGRSSLRVPLPDAPAGGGAGQG
ncbi:iron-containing redox enzyme family protein [Kitasatospora sp. RB6PN24]|uniref:iron-containing redox enzyme family protein n=1 Tax=Kitasatospora humi TaxID=2893891 RepID=UPI001E4CB4DE|nr:iron-containing redox enzyme family protein [Kitasatospora humi]MCC9305757.1 iron-containing redox enzyme family protein [Kitasatospora humi]